jgi:hypothetical protein
LLNLLPAIAYGADFPIDEDAEANDSVNHYQLDALDLVKTDIEH